VSTNLRPRRTLLSVCLARDFLSTSSLFMGEITLGMLTVWWFRKSKVEYI